MTTRRGFLTSGATAVVTAAVLPIAAPITAAASATTPSANDTTAVDPQGLNDEYRRYIAMVGAAQGPQ